MCNIINIKEFLDEKVNTYKRKEFIEEDPISIPHNFTDKKDIEISAFFAATIAWGKRSNILKAGKKMLEIMNYSPYDFIMNVDVNYFKKKDGALYRTFKYIDFAYFILSLRNIYKNFDSLELAFFDKTNDIKEAIINFNNIFFSLKHQTRTRKHIANPLKKSPAKRINMFLRWMIRKDEVDFGIWNKVDASDIFIPLDIHSSRVARSLGLLKRLSNDWKAVEELTRNLKEFDPNDPVKYDFALFGLGVYEKFP